MDAHLYGSVAEIKAEIAGGAADPHRKVAAVLFGKLPEQVEPDERRWGKWLNMAAVIGLSEAGFADLCQAPADIVQYMWEKYRRLVLA